jgi:cell division initiation protein
LNCCCSISTGVIFIISPHSYGKILKGSHQKCISLKEEIKKSKEEAENFRRKEKMINDTMVNCQKIAADFKANAEREAELIIAQARAESEKTLAEAQQRLARIKEEILDAKKRKIQFETALKSMVESHLKILDLETKEEDE